MIAVDKETFQAEVKDAGGLVLVDFWSESCESCKALMPDVEALAEKYGQQVKFAKLDVAKARRLAIGEKVLGLPTIVLYKDGEKIDEVNKDDATAGNIEAMIQKNL
ncbi:MAG: thioredoxin family protein [Clostridiales bacterium]|nr:thioredoxin family protein [Clostridiales bacterium]